MSLATETWDRREGSADSEASRHRVPDAQQEIDSLELLGTGTRIVLGVRGPDLGEVDDIDLGSEIYNVFTIEDERITRIEDYLRRVQALAAAGLEPV